MNQIDEVIKNKPFFTGQNGVAEAIITLYEKEMNVSFSEEYKRYLKEIGLASFEGHELTGICKFDRLDVKKTTAKYTDLGYALPNNSYIIEVSGVDGIVFAQKTSGEIFICNINTIPIKVANSLREYVER